MTGSRHGAREDRRGGGRHRRPDHRPPGPPQRPQQQGAGRVARGGGHHRVGPRHPCRRPDRGGGGVLRRGRHEGRARGDAGPWRHAHRRRPRGRPERRGPDLREPGVHGGPVREDPPAPSTGHRRRERRGARWWLRARARLRHPLRRRVGQLRRRVHQAWRVGLRHGHQLPPSPARRRLPLGRAPADRPGFDAAEAEHIGLVLDVVHDGAVVERALVTAREIARTARWRCG